MKQDKSKTLSPEHKLFLKKIETQKVVVLLLQIGAFIAFLGLWELLTYVGFLDSFFVSSPTRIVKMLGNLISSNEMAIHVWYTLFETILGFSISMVLAISIALILWWNAIMQRVFDPYLVILNSLPKIALGPVIIIWVGNGISAIVAMCVLICVIVATLSLLSAYRSVEKEKIMLMESMGATKWQILTKLILPATVPELMSVLKIIVGLSWVGTIMGEYLSSQYGLGSLIVYGGIVFNLDLVMASTFLLCVMAGLMYFTVHFIEKRITQHR